MRWAFPVPAAGGHCGPGRLQHSTQRPAPPLAPLGSAHAHEQAERHCHPRPGPGGHALPLRGNTPGGGFDCSGLGMAMCTATRWAAPPRTVAQLNGWGRWTAANGAPATWRCLAARPTHAGIYWSGRGGARKPSTGGEVPGLAWHLVAGRYWGGGGGGGGGGRIVSAALNCGWPQT